MTPRYRPYAVLLAIAAVAVMSASIGAQSASKPAATPAAAAAATRWTPIRTPDGQRTWAERIATAVQAVFAKPELREAMHRVQYFGSHTDTEGPPPYSSPAERSPA